MVLRMVFPVLPMLFWPNSGRQASQAISERINQGGADRRMRVVSPPTTMISTPSFALRP